MRQSVETLGKIVERYEIRYHTLQDQLNPIGNANFLDFAGYCVCAIDNQLSWFSEAPEVWNTVRGHFVEQLQLLRPYLRLIEQQSEFAERETKSPDGYLGKITAPEGIGYKKHYLTLARQQFEKHTQEEKINRSRGDNTIAVCD